VLYSSSEVFFFLLLCGDVSTKRGSYCPESLPLLRSFDVSIGDSLFAALGLGSYLLCVINLLVLVDFLLLGCSFLGPTTSFLRRRGFLIDILLLLDWATTSFLGRRSFLLLLFLLDSLLLFGWATTSLLWRRGLVFTLINLFLGYLLAPSLLGGRRLFIVLIGVLGFATTLLGGLLVIVVVLLGLLLGDFGAETRLARAVDLKIL
jgi:hypothetical protein